MPWITRFLALIESILADRTRLAIEDSDRMIWILMRITLNTWRHRLIIVNPDLCVRYHRQRSPPRL